MNSNSDNIIQLLSFRLNEVRKNSFWRVQQPKDKNNFLIDY